MSTAKTAKVGRYRYVLSVSNDIPEDDLDRFRGIAVASWREGVAREGYQPFGEPTATLAREAIPGTFPDSDEEMPRRAWQVAGRVLPADVPLPADISEVRIGMTPATLTLADFLLALPYSDHPDYRDEWRP